MSKHGKTLKGVLSGRADANIRFSDLCGLLRSLGFSERTRGSHHIFAREGIEEILNLQPRDGKSKPYQVKQVREIIIVNELGPSEEAATDESQEPENEEGD